MTPSARRPGRLSISGSLQAEPGLVLFALGVSSPQNTNMLQLAICIVLSLCIMQALAITPAQRIEEKPWGTTADGKPVKLFTLHNATGMTVSVMEYGGVITQIQAPDRTGKMVNV